MWSVDNFDNIPDAYGIMVEIERLNVSRVLLLLQSLRSRLDNLTKHAQHVEVVSLKPNNNTNRLRTAKRNRKMMK